MPWKRFFNKKWMRLPFFVLCLTPALLLAWRGFNGGLGANPIEFITHATGDWTLRFLAITLAVTPLRKLLRWPELVRFRRMLGLFAFFYGCLHFLTYVWLDKFFDLAEITKDIVKRPFITVGFTAFILLVPLAITSTVGWIQRLGGQRWRMLHRLVYVSAVAGVAHYYWLVKSDITWPVFYGAIITVLLAYRVASKLTGAARGIASSRAVKKSRLIRWLVRYVVLLSCLSLSAEQIKTGPDIGTKAPEFEALDQHGQMQNLPSLAGPNGMILVFYRSADW